MTPVRDVILVRRDSPCEGLVLAVTPLGRMTVNIGDHVAFDEDAGVQYGEFLLMRSREVHVHVTHRIQQTFSQAFPR